MSNYSSRPTSADVNDRILASLRSISSQKPSLQKKRKHLEHMQSLTYWKKDVVDQKIESLKKRLKDEENVKIKKKKFVNKKSEKLLEHKRAKKPVEDILIGWISQKNKNQERLEKILQHPFKPKLNPKSLKMMSYRNDPLSRSRPSSSVQRMLTSQSDQWLNHGLSIKKFTKQSFYKNLDDDRLMLSPRSLLNSDRKQMNSIKRQIAQYRDQQKILNERQTVKDGYNIYRRVTEQILLDQQFYEFEIF